MKDKKIILLIVLIILMLLGMAISKTNKQKNVSWEPTFVNSETDPYGTYIAYKLLDDIFDKNKVRSTRRPIYNNLKKDVEEYFYYDDTEYYGKSDNSYSSDYYRDEYDEVKVEIDQVIVDSLTLLVKAGEREKAINLFRENSDAYYSEAVKYIDELELSIQRTESIKQTDSAARYRDLDAIKDTTSYVFINTDFSVDRLDLTYLLNFVGLGNNVFISAESFSKNLLDSLNIKTKIVNLQNDTIFTLKDFPNKKYRFGNVYSQIKFSINNNAPGKFPVHALGFNNGGDTVFLDVQYGKGHFYLHTLPSSFANTYLLDTDKYDFAFKSLSYLPKSSTVIWDEYQKQGPIGDDNMFRVIFDSLPLRIAFYLILFGLLLFALFRAKRSQRVIPVINRPVNSSLEFLGTISDLYYRKKDLRDIVVKRQAYLLDFIRKNYYLSTENVNNDFILALALKSGYELDKIKKIFELYSDLSSLVFISNESFLEYNGLLESFYKTAKTN